jgi:hypothetical protein
MINSKKAFALFLTLFLLSTFSFLAIYILEIKTLQSDSKTKLHQKIQASFHLDFSKKVILNMDLSNNSNPCVNEVTINNETFEIYANISYISDKIDCLNSTNTNFDELYTKGVAIVDLYVKSRSSTFKIKLHERFLKKL